jgi:hypothetical protein
LTAHQIIIEAHHVRRPVKLADEDELIPVTLPMSVARMYLAMQGDWNLPPLAGICTAPLLSADGSVRTAEGYDSASRMWCESVPDLTGLIPDRPTKSDAAAALGLIRETFKTFCFADAETMEDTASGMAVVDLSKPPGRDESSFLVALSTAVCRPSLHLAPGVLLRAASMSGAGAGKGLLARCICIIAFGCEPHAVTAGATADELEKRIAAELIAGDPALFLDNGLTVSEDHAKRFVTVDFDPRTEDPVTMQSPCRFSHRSANSLASLSVVKRCVASTQDFDAATCSIFLRIPA